MRLDFCVACGCDNPGSLEHHHLVPRSHGGGDEEENIATFCGPCHGKIHGYSRKFGISQLVREGLARAKAAGKTLGGDRGNLPALARKAAQASVARRVEAARNRTADFAPIIAEIRASGATSLRRIAAELNARNIKTPRGGEWSAAQVMRTLDGLSVSAPSTDTSERHETSNS